MDVSPNILSHQHSNTLTTPQTQSYLQKMPAPRTCATCVTGEHHVGRCYHRRGLLVQLVWQGMITSPHTVLYTPHMPLHHMATPNRAMPRLHGNRAMPRLHGNRAMPRLPVPCPSAWPSTGDAGRFKHCLVPTHSEPADQGRGSGSASMAVDQAQGPGSANLHPEPLHDCSPDMTVAPT